MRLLLALFFCVLSCAAFAQDASPHANAVRDFVAASNRHDVDAMLAATVDDFRWIQVVSDKASTEVFGHVDLRSWLESYFASTPTAKSELGPISVNGAFASAVETASWTSADGTLRTQASTSVYEFAPDGRIRHVWYFNAQPVPGAAPPETPEASDE